MGAAGQDLPSAPSPAVEPGSQSAIEPGSELTIYLVTMDQGDAVWERFGHNAIWIRDDFRGTDVAYNWGLFDFDQEDFIPRFLRGEMLYWMGGFDAHRMVDHYVEENRTVERQELRLTPAQRVALRDFAEWNALPENRFYRYHYFRDNCSTRIRDALDLALGGILEEQFADRPAGRTWRSVVRDLTEVSIPQFLAMDLLMGPDTDRSISQWEEMFIPMDLRDRLREVQVSGPAGEPVSLVLQEEVLFRSDRQEAEGRSRILFPLLLFGSLALGAAAVLLARGLTVGGAGPERVAGTGDTAGSETREYPRRGPRPAAIALALLGSGWGFLTGVAGAMMVALWVGTHHVAGHGNLNLFQTSPLGLALAVLIPLMVLRGRSRRATVTLAGAAVGLSLFGLVLHPLPWTIQDNLLIIAAVLPAHLGIWWALRSLAPSPAGLGGR